MQDHNQRRPTSNQIGFLLYGAILGALTILPVIALSYLGAMALGLSFIPFDVFDWLARVLPGNIVVFGIESMVRVITLLGLGPTDTTAKLFEQTLGILIMIGIGAVLGAVIGLLLTRTSSSGKSIGTMAGAGLFIVIAGIVLSLNNADITGALLTLLWNAILIVGWGRLLGGWLERTAQPTDASEPMVDTVSRRALLLKLAGGSLGVAVVATGLGRLLDSMGDERGAGQPLSDLATPGPGGVSGAPTLAPLPRAQETEQATLRDRVPVAPGTRLDLTPTAEFYRIDIATLPPVLDQRTWKLEVKGLFDRPRPLTLTDMIAYPQFTQTITQGCISNPIGGDLIGTTHYTGARIRDVLQDLGIRSQAKSLLIRAADGFFESVGMQDLMDPRTLLVYGMNGETLPIDHGFPLRIYIANRFGMKQPKWITSIEAIDRDGPGYWVERGWSAEAYVQTQSVIDTVAKNNIENGRVPIGGIAWAGDRGIKKVEIQADRGEWNEATLRTPPLGPLTWVQWRYDWPLVRGTHTFRVRATDGTGALQTIIVADTFPDGATGYHEVTVIL